MAVNRKRKPKASMTSAQENKFLKLVLLLCFVAALWLIFAPNTGFLALLRQRSELKTLQAETQNLTAQNEKLRADIKKIKTDVKYLEEISRRDYGLVKENEILFEFKKSKTSKKD